MYNRALKLITTILPHTKYGTYSTELDKLARKLLPDFVGVYSYDTLPALKNGQSAIVNTDVAGKPGKHWLAVAASNNEVMQYDSFARNSIDKKSQKLNVTSTEPDAEQNEDESNCGQRALAFLVVYDSLGSSQAYSI